MSPEQLPVDERREPQLGAQSFTAPEPEADHPLGADAVALPEPEDSGVDTDSLWTADLPPGDPGAGAPWMRDRRKLALLVVGLVAGVLVLTALASLFRSSEPQIAPAPAAALDTAISADIKSMQTRLAQQQQNHQALAAELDALRAQVGKTQQAPGAVAQLEERLGALENRLQGASDLEQFIDRMEARLDEVAARITVLDDGLNAKRPPGGAQGQNAPPTPQVELPFHLAAIEVWDGRVFASLLHEGRQVLVQPGDQCAGWTVQSIDQARRTVRFVRDGVTAVRRAPK